MVWSSEWACFTVSNVGPGVDLAERGQMGSPTIPDFGSFEFLGWANPRSGPAGLACADQLNKAGHFVMVYERNDRMGSSHVRHLLDKSHRETKHDHACIDLPLLQPKQGYRKLPNSI